MGAVWAPDGRRIIFGSHRAGEMSDLYEKSISAAEDAEALLKSNEWKEPLSWSPMEPLLYQTVGAPTKLDLWVLRSASTRSRFRFFGRNLTNLKVISLRTALGRLRIG